MLLSGLQIPPLSPWAFVRQRFLALQRNLALTPDQYDDGVTKHKGIVACLNRAYRNIDDDTNHRLLIGSWGKETRVRPPRDIDVLFILPNEVFWRFQERTGNRQSALLQEVKYWLQQTYPQTDLRGDGQVVSVPFNSYRLEVVPAFNREGGGFFICDTNNGGSYKHVDPNAELAVLSAHDTLKNGNVRKLTRILKQWQRNCNVPIKSFHLEALVIEMLQKFDYGGASEFWFDWLVRDFFAHAIGRANGTFFMPTTYETISLGNDWLSRAESAYSRALYACEYEKNNDDRQAGEEWQKIFGTEIPVTIG